MSEWERPAQPPAPFSSERKKRTLLSKSTMKSLKELLDNKFLYFPVDMETTNFHSLYGEAIEKNFLHPIRVYALVEYLGVETAFMEGVGIDKKTGLTVNFHKRRLNRRSKFICKRRRLRQIWKYLL